jgi:hypothetical protein
MNTDIRTAHCDCDPRSTNVYAADPVVSVHKAYSSALQNSYYCHHTRCDDTKVTFSARLSRKL